MKQNTKKETVGILGYGEIGKAVAQFYKNPKIKDLQRNDGLQGVDILHVCIPWSEKFIDIVKKEIAFVKPRLTIIHSTVVPGTTKKIGSMIVHSPVRGMHPYLQKSIKTFVKYIGADTHQASRLAENHFNKIGITTKTFLPSATTELAKLMDTTYYGLIIAWHGEMKKMCSHLGVDFDEAVTQFNRTYNEGYRKMGKYHVVRPVLSPPNPHIGGHCIIPNARLLRKNFSSKAIDLILSYQED